MVMVTSGAIARGMRLMELPVRPRAMDELQAASAVGQGDLFRAYESRLAGARHPRRPGAADRGRHRRPHQLPERPPDPAAAARVGGGAGVNENDTTATDEITFGDNDFLAAQVAILLEARLLVLLTNVDGLYTADPRLEPERRADRRGERLRRARAARDRRPHLGLRLRRDAQQGRGGGDGERGRASRR